MVKLCIFSSGHAQFILLWRLIGKKARAACVKVQVVSLTAEMKLAIALQLICWFPNSSVEDLCKPASYSVQGRVLKNHTITTATAEQIEDCIMQCMEHPGCHSSNFYRKDRMCELNDKTHASHPEDMREVHLTNYLENTFRPFTCSRDSDCGSNLLCLRSLKCGGKFDR